MDKGEVVLIEEEQDQVVEQEIELTLPDAIREVLQNSLHRRGLARGLRESVKALDRRQARLVVLATDCDKPEYKKLIQCLASEKNVNIIEVPTKEALGKMVGLCKYDKKGEARKVVKTSCVVIKDFGKGSRALDFVLQHLKQKK